MAGGLNPLPGNIRPQLLPAKEAVDYLAARGLNLTESFNWQDVWQEEHAAQFTVSRLTRADLLAAVHEQLMRAVQDGISLQEFSDNLEPQLQAAGWWGTVDQVDPSTGETVSTTFDASRLKLIYDVNLSQSYAAGLWNRVERNKTTLPFIYYRTMRDERVRASHRVWDGVALPVDDPFWDTHYPPNGWRCRCTAYGIDEKGLQQMEGAGLPVKLDAPQVQWIDYVNKRTGEITRTPIGIDPGFAYNPGKQAARASNLLDVAASKIESIPAPIASETVQDLVASEAFKIWFEHPEGNFPLVILPEADAALIGAQTKVGKMSADTAAKQAAEHPELTADEYAAAQRVVDAPSEMVQDGQYNLIYILEEADDDAGGHVLVVKATKSGNGVWVTSYRRLSRDDAMRDREIRRLLKKSGN